MQSRFGCKSFPQLPFFASKVEQTRVESHVLDSTTALRAFALTMKILKTSTPIRITTPK